MKTFPKVVLLLLAAIIALKFLPFTLGLGFLLAGLVFGAVALGFSFLAVVGGTIVALVAALSPIWIPVLVIVGLIALIKDSRQPSRKL